MYAYREAQFSLFEVDIRSHSGFFVVYLKLVSFRHACPCTYMYIHVRGFSEEPSFVLLLNVWSSCSDVDLTMNTSTSDGKSTFFGYGFSQVTWPQTLSYCAYSVFKQYGDILGVSPPPFNQLLNLYVVCPQSDSVCQCATLLLTF